MFIIPQFAYERMTFHYVHKATLLKRFPHLCSTSRGVGGRMGSITARRRAGFVDPGCRSKADPPQPPSRVAGAIGRSILMLAENHPGDLGRAQHREGLAKDLSPLAIQFDVFVGCCRHATSYGHADEPVAAGRDVCRVFHGFHSPAHPRMFRFCSCAA